MNNLWDEQSMRVVKDKIGIDNIIIEKREDQIKSIIVDNSKEYVKGVGFEPKK